MSKPDLPQIAVIVLGAGNGTRLGRAEPKAFVHLAGRPTLAHALEAVFGMRESPQIIVTVPQSFVPLAIELARSVPGNVGNSVTVVVGGSTRQQSVAAALSELAPSVKIVLVHDAARPLTPSLVFDSIAAEVARTKAAVVPGLPVADTIKRIDEFGLVVETVDRSILTAVQTPQGFPRDELVRAHALAECEFTDDSALVAAAGYAVSVIAGDSLAFKITTAWELRRAEQLFSGSAAAGIRVGTGTDAHAYDDETPMWLGGLFWPGVAGLNGHSDGDVVCHAICDAMLSAVRLGDLGSVFGTAEPRLAGARGEVFLRETLALVKDAGFVVGNVSVQLVGNAPKFAPRRLESESLLSHILNATVSIAATTTDSLGFTGRGEGMAAIATVLLHARTAADPAVAL
ncbi:2-C-methyl-D-erythritol 4-phosphate cytidylyltransferase [Cryobacterium sp. Y11]|jgi:2-C-methyl-D-erythritol 4-phosphate cytidylyltransferase/2-C-methyl-D-erythritol 2,4-cyclodiphosphate synthase|uniref:2-C-methyl-D-erythritol 4-phosphate cytidylyltransferase n=1 Tax=Cryobacterium sp. Y11 TaxID=2045016 RepID=UPI000CE4B8AE|nr:2-C-methyl-D-erythritol 4-phosphate cytidylyltransferase [Cryobacterium sp. Y11]